MFLIKCYLMLKNARFTAFTVSVFIEGKPARGVKLPPPIQIRICGQIYKPDLLEYYLARPSQNNDIRNPFVAVFASYYFLVSEKWNDYQSDYLGDISDIGDFLEQSLPKELRMSSSTSLHRRESRIVLRHHRPNKNLFSEDFTYHMLMLTIHSLMRMT